MIDDGMQERVYFAMHAPDRPAEDVARDMDRKPEDVLAFFGINRGMTVLDLMAGTGYYTELLSAAVGPEGSVYSHNDMMALRMRHGAIQKAMDRRLARNRLPNTRLWTREITSLGLQEEVDVATLILNLHDLYIFGGEQRVVDALENIRVALKPGGILGVVDHAGIRDYNNNHLHRIDPDIARELIIKAGFSIVNWSSTLANFEDN
ncbi:MAG: SAM-dependent methyltransferase, partial [Gammaproteobacteria bacterium]